MKNLTRWIFLALMLTSCAVPTQPQAATTPQAVLAQSIAAQPSPTTALPAAKVASSLPVAAAPTSTLPPTQAPTLIPTAPPPTETPAAQPASPDTGGLPQGINPLTGLPASDPSLLSLPPALVSVSNFPASARPQAGLSFSPYVFEMTIGEGMTRFLAMFYGQFPQASPQGVSGANPRADQAAVGPIRSGRLPYESLRNLYNGFLVMASASSDVGSQLNSFTNIFGSDSDNINSALIDVTQLQSIAQSRLQEGKTLNLAVNTFNPAAPTGGSDASTLHVFYSFLNQVLWTYNPTSGAYLRSQDQADGSGEFFPATDRLTGNQLAFQNVIVLFANHSYLNRAKTLIDIDLLYTRGKAVLFRDGKAYPITWSTENGEYEKTTGLLRPIRFLDSSGAPMALKPGSTWVEIVDVTTSFDQTKPGAWKARFYNP